MKKTSPKPEKLAPLVTATPTLPKPSCSKKPITERFPVVGIGASAGGLEALELFLSHVPAGSGMAYIIIQHLDPTRTCILPELLQHATKMAVIQAKQSTLVEPDSVYVIPANKAMSIIHGELHLSRPSAPRGQRLPINFFFTSLAQERKELGVCVILSGMGEDGTEGVQAIKGAGGYVLVQEPASAKFDSMPRSAIATGLVDGVGPAENLPGMISICMQRRSMKSARCPMPEQESAGLEDIVRLLRGHTGHDFSLYKKSTVSRRVERRMGIHQMTQPAQYAQYLRDNPQEIQLLFNEMLIGVTSFFRDAAAWDYLRDRILPALLDCRPANQGFRAWVPGCSSGEEAFSLAIIFREAVEARGPAKHCRLQIFATDLDPEAIIRARQSVYPESISAGISPERLQRFFVKEDGKYRISKEIRESVVFAQQDVVMDPPFTKLDILICRNLLIYLEAQLQKKLLPLFHYSLKPGGILFLGSAETTGGFTDLFSSEAGSLKLYRRLSPALRNGPVDFPPSFVPPIHDVPAPSSQLMPTENLQTLAEQVILQQHTPPAVLTSSKGDVVFISGRIGKYLEPAAGKANLNLFAMARDELRGDLSTAFLKTVHGAGIVKVNVLMTAPDSSRQLVELDVQRLEGPEALRGMVLIVFKDLPKTPEHKEARSKSAPSTGNARINEMRREILQLREELGTTREEIQTSQEELRSANEELQSANEELQSTNEELTTSTEEMQSMNEELQTINAELQAKVDELAHTASDMKNLLDSTDIATIFLDSNLKVRRFTPRATRIIKFIHGDVGRPITDLASELEYPELAADAQDVLHTLIFSEKQISARDDRWFTVRIMPYRTIDDRIDGVVITLTDITAHRKLLAASKDRERPSEEISIQRK